MPALLGVRSAIRGAALAFGGLLASCTGEEETTASLQLSGAPPAHIAVGEHYAFAPSVTGGEGTALTFTSTARPAWLALDSATGTMTGAPTAADIGVYRGISLQASDGRTTAQLAPFDLEVVAVGSRAVTIAWQAPTANEDGSPLTDLAGFDIRYGRQPARYSHHVQVPTVGVASHMVVGLVPGNYYFTVSARNHRDVGSEPAPEMSIVVR